MKSSVMLSFLVALAFGGAGCAKHGAEIRPMGCEPVGEPGIERVDAEGLEGEYELTLVATEGKAAGTSASGRLWLYANPPDMRGIPSAGGGVRSDATAPLYGATNVDVEVVGALRLGDLISRDPQAPGVLVVERSDQITLRLGSEANRRGVLRFDGGYLALRVQKVSETGFAGSWASGVAEVQARGQFCAVRAKH